MAQAWCGNVEMSPAGAGSFHLAPLVCRDGCIIKRRCRRRNVALAPAATTQIHLSDAGEPFSVKVQHFHPTPRLMRLDHLSHRLSVLVLPLFQDDLFAF